MEARERQGDKRKKIGEGEGERCGRKFQRKDKRARERDRLVRAEGGQRRDNEGVIYGEVRARARKRDGRRGKQSGIVNYSREERRDHAVLKRRMKNRAKKEDEREEGLPSRLEKYLILRFSIVLSQTDGET